MIQDNLNRVRENIVDNCRLSGRNPEDVILIAVSKTKPLEDLREAYDCGMRDFGENKVQELLEKIPEMPTDVRWHMIGHLQRNKVKYIVDKVYMIHGVDSLRLAEEISKEATRRGVTVRILMEVNVAGEDTKYGVSLQDAPALAGEIGKLPGISLQGLMTIAPFVDDAEENRQIFAKLRQLAVDISKKNIDNVSMKVLSMGMTGDYQVAVQEGATYVRVGTGIFGERNYQIS